MKHFAKYIAGLLLVTILMVSSSSIVSASRSNNTSEAKSRRYNYESWGLSVEVPQGWDVTPPSTKGIGTVLTISPKLLYNESTTKIQDLDTSSDPKIEVGAYLTAWTNDRTLEDWSIQYDRVHSVQDEKSKTNDTHYVQAELGDLNKVVIAEKVTSDEDVIRYANIARGEIVWFVWSTGTDKYIFERVVNSLEFEANAPHSVEEMYGFEPFNLDDMLAAYDETEKGAIPSIASSWKVPLSGTANCKSSAHNNDQSQFAVDVAKPAWTSIYSSNHGDVISAGYSGGYGNLVRINYDGYKVYYAHLIAFSSNVLHYNWIAKDRSVGYVGSTGDSTGNHLHFEIRNESNNIGASLVGMTGFSTAGHTYPYPGDPEAYPDDPAEGTCGSLTR